jgi:hypothetical protein
MLDETVTGDVETTLAEMKRTAFDLISGAMAEAEAEGIEPDIVTQAALFAVLVGLVSTWGEVAVAGFAERLPERILAGEFTLDRRLQ